MRTFRFYATVPAFCAFTSSAFWTHSSMTFQKRSISSPRGMRTPSSPGGNSCTIVRPVCVPFSLASSSDPSVTTRTSNLSRRSGPWGLAGSKS
ncbi:hypothetical protein RRF57_000200 [Xylaria bambusicola]|uniref:Uncharacterized protein n=1 Tax=Xylaria bambusicola TaxID=326684 RepID=A0AAN7UN67_9PEZI